METSRSSPRMRTALQSMRALLSFFMIFTLLAPNIAFADDRYWVGQGGTLNDWHDTNNWGTSFTATTGGSSVPGIGDEAFFDENAEGNVATIRNNVTVKGIRLGAQFTGTIIAYSGSRIRVGSGGVRMGSGRIMLGTGVNLVISGAYTQTGGDLGNGRASSQLVLSGGLTIRQRARFRFSGTIVFEGYADQTFYFSGAIVPKTSSARMTDGFVSFSGITVNNIGGTTADDIHVSGALLAIRTLTVTQGNFELRGTPTDTAGRASVPMNVSGAITIGNNSQATLTTDANIRMSGSLSTGAAGSFFMTGGTLVMNGIRQDLDVSGGGGRGIHTLQVRATSGVYLTAYTLVQSSLLVHSGSYLTFAANKLALTGGTVTNYATIRENTGMLYHTGSLLFIANSSYIPLAEFKSGDTMYFTLTESDENIDGTTNDTQTVTVSIASGDSESVTLTETYDDSGVFRGSIVTKNAEATSNDGTLQATADKVVTATVSDAQDGQSISDTTVLTAVGSAGSTSGTNSGGGSSASRSAGGGGGGNKSKTTTKTPVKGVKKPVSRVPAKKKVVKKKTSKKADAKSKAAARKAARRGR